MTICMNNTNSKDNKAWRPQVGVKMNTVLQL